MQKHSIGLLGLTMAGIGSIIGSGWLFGAWKAARLAGPAALLAWPIGAIIIILVALAYAELGARYPTTGGMARYTQLSHGSLAGFIAGWANWIAIVSVISIEAVSSIQYLSSWNYGWARALYNTETNNLSGSGIFLSAILIVIYFLLNYWSLRLFLRSMIYITIFKIAVPFLTCVALIIAAFMQHKTNFSHGNFMPYGISGVFTAVATAGVIFAFNGFQTPINLSGEAKNPSRHVPIAVFLSVFITFVLYILLQYAFIIAIKPNEIAQGWAQLYMSSPFVHLALAFNLNWLAILLYLDAFISPSGTGITYMATTSRMLYAMQKSGYMPGPLGKLHPFYHIPRWGMWVNLIVSFIFLYLFRGWSSLVEIISVSTIISYINGPVSAVALRRWGKKIHPPLHIKGLIWTAPIAFIVISWVLYWARWPLTGEVILIMVIGLPIYFYYQHKDKWVKFRNQWRSGIWLVIYLIVMAFISFIGSKSFGGLGWMDTTWSMIVVSAVALLFYYWGLHSSFIKRDPDSIHSNENDISS